MNTRGLPGDNWAPVYKSWLWVERRVATSFDMLHPRSWAHQARLGFDLAVLRHVLNPKSLIQVNVL